jgi:hypothetical protein
MMIKEERIALLQLSTRLIDWVRTVELDSAQKKEFIKIMGELRQIISWIPEIDY